jgi:hypothetical protein
MARTDDSGAVWGRPEAVDSLGRRPGRRRPLVLALLGAASLLAGAYLGSNAASGQPLVPASAPVSAVAPTPGLTTCASVGVRIEPGNFPAEGVPEVSVVRLYRADPDGQAVLLVPEAHVLRSTSDPDGTLSLSVLVRSGPEGDDQPAIDVAGASASRSLVATVLYDVDPVRVLDDCRGV